MPIRLTLPDWGQEFVWYRNYARLMQDRYGLACQFIEGEELYETTGSRAFRGGFIEYESAHLHLLNYALGLVAAMTYNSLRDHFGE